MLFRSVADLMKIFFGNVVGHDRVSSIVFFRVCAAEIDEIIILRMQKGGETFQQIHLLRALKSRDISVKLECDQPVAACRQCLGGLVGSVV